MPINVSRSSTEKDGPLMTTSTLEPTEEVVSAGPVEKDEPNTRIAESGSSNSSNESDSSSEQNTLESDLSSKSITLIVKPRVSNRIAAQFTSRSRNAWTSNQSANSNKRKRRSGRRYSLLRKKVKLKTNCSVSQGGPNSAKTKPKPERASGVAKENATEKNNASNFNAQYIDNKNKYTPVTLFMRSALIGPCKASQFFSIRSNMLLPIWPNLLLVISTELFKIIN